MNQKIKDLKGQKIAIHCPTEQEADELMKILYENGYTWADGKNIYAHTNNRWRVNKQETCYSLN